MTKQRHRYKKTVACLVDEARKVFAVPSNNLSLKSWVKLYNSIIVPVLTYGCEVWLLVSDIKPNFEPFDKTNFEKTQNMILKNLLGVYGKISNLELLVMNSELFRWLLNHID